ncbi:tetratricopeptide repeat protein, partial [Azospirillum sp.]|uniref:tetratricopeptide repeat protein n=1 Tax=Azospirillum sp. TaxID=34012 RepID=UPI002D24ED82
MTSTTTGPLFTQAVALHRDGHLAQAEALYERVLADEPHHLDALYSLGLLHRALGRFDAAAHGLFGVVQRAPEHAGAWRALALVMRAMRHPDAEVALRRALRDTPADAELSTELGLALVEAGRFAEAEPILRGGAEAHPGDVILHFALGRALHGLHRFAEAAACYRRCLSIDRGLAAAHNNLGLSLIELRRPQDGAAALRRALVLTPNDAAALNGLGTGLDGQGDTGGAEAAYRRALTLRPDYLHALNNLAHSLACRHDVAAGAACRRRAIVVQPDRADPYTALGSAALEQDRLAEAERLHHRALRLAPDHLAALTNLGLVRQIQGRLNEASALQRRTLVLDPACADGHANLGLLFWLARDRAAAERCLSRALLLDAALGPAHLNLGMIRLQRGDLGGGWLEYQWRFRAKGYTDRAIAAPPWGGEDPAGRSILVWREQGVGDEILFSSCYADLTARAGRVVIECDARLVGLFARSFPAATVRAETTAADGGETVVPPDADLHVPAGRLPMFLRGRLAAFPSASRRGGPGWLEPDPARVAAWRSRLDALGPGLRVGIAWRSQLMTTDRLVAYTRIEQWAPVFEVPGVTFVNLQYDDCAAELADAERRFGVIVHRWADLDLKDDFEGTAALIANLDLVVSPATSVGELAAAVGTPVWRLGGPDWTQLSSAVRPWFPAMRLFQPRPGETLADTLATVAHRLRRLAAPEPAPEPDVEAVVQEAIARYRAGDLQGAAAAAHEALSGRPRHPVAHHLLGVIRKRQGDVEAAASHFAVAAVADPGNAAAYAGLADALRLMGRSGAAEAAQRNAIAAQPDAAGHWVNHTAALYGAKRVEEAERACRRAARLRPDLALTHTHLGNLLAAGGRRDGAAAAHRRALALDPAFADAHTNLGTVLLGLERFDAAATALRRAVTVNGSLAAAWTNLGNACSALGRLDEAETHHRTAITLDAGLTDAHSNLALLLQRRHRPDEALAEYRQALAADPRNAQAHHNLAFFLLERGDLRQGWPEHDWRFSTDEFRPHARRFAMRSWRGENVNAARVLVWREQGVGDELMFASCYADLIGRARHVIVECDPRLAGLFARSFPTATVRAPTDDPRDADVHVPAGSLPRFLRPELRRFPARASWLVADAERVRAWRERVAALGPGLVVGIGWRSGLMTRERAGAYTRLEAWGPVLAVPGVRFVNLQYDECAAEIADAE